MKEVVKMLNFKQFCETLRKYEVALTGYNTNLPVGKEVGYQMFYLPNDHVCHGIKFAFLDKRLAYNIYKICSNDYNSGDDVNVWTRMHGRSIQKCNALYLYNTYVQNAQNVK